MEEEHSKKWILEQYLNTASYGTNNGRTAVGVEAASQVYFNKPVADLDLDEAALLAGLPQAPSRVQPVRLAPRRRSSGATRCCARCTSRATSRWQQEKKAVKSGLGLERGYRYETIQGDRYFFDYVEQELIERYGVNTVRQGGLEVYTTIDPRLQAVAQRAVDNGVASLGGPVAGAGLDRRRQRPHRRDGLLGRLRDRQVQPRRPGPPPARVVVQAVRAGDGDQPGHRPRLHLLRGREPGEPQHGPVRGALGGQQRRRHERRRDAEPARRDRRLRQRRLRPARPRRRARELRRDGQRPGDRGAARRLPRRGDRRAHGRRLAARHGRRLRHLRNGGVHHTATAIDRVEFPNGDVDEPDEGRAQPRPDRGRGLRGHRRARGGGRQRHGYRRQLCGSGATWPARPARPTTTPTPGSSATRRTCRRRSGSATPTSRTSMGSSRLRWDLLGADWNDFMSVADPACEPFDGSRRAARPELLLRRARRLRRRAEYDDSPTTYDADHHDHDRRPTTTTTAAAATAPTRPASKTAADLPTTAKQRVRADRERCASGSSVDPSARSPLAATVAIGSGDDAAVTVPGGATATSVDMAVEGVHFRRSTAPPAAIGHKALAAALSDLAAMGATPGEAYVQLGLPARLRRGRRAWRWPTASPACAREHGVAVLGGDISRAPVLVIAVTVVGHAPSPETLVRRDGARRGRGDPRDRRAGRGRGGAAAAGGPGASRSRCRRRRRRRAGRAPAPPGPADRRGPRLAAAGASAMIDVSDGLLRRRGPSRAGERRRDRARGRGAPGGRRASPRWPRRPDVDPLDAGSRRGRGLRAARGCLPAAGCRKASDGRAQPRGSCRVRSGGVAPRANRRVESTPAGSTIFVLARGSQVAANPPDDSDVPEDLAGEYAGVHCVLALRDPMLELGQGGLFTLGVQCRASRVALRCRFPFACIIGRCGGRVDRAWRRACHVRYPSRLGSNP